MSRVDEFEWFAAWADGTSPLYARLSRAVVEDDGLLAFAEAAREDQPAPHLLFAAVHDRLARGRRPSASPILRHLRRRPGRPQCG